jgi:CHAD domain-containing protein
MARARQIADVSPGDPFGAVAAKTIAVRTEEVFARHEQVLAVEDIEALHDMRVATRRLRAALEVFEPCFPRHAYRRVLRDVKRLADALGKRRDRDVQIAWLERYAAARRGEERAAVLAFVEHLRAEQASANRALAEVLDEAKDSDLEGRLRDLATRTISARDGSARRARPGAHVKRAHHARGVHEREAAPASGSQRALAARRTR